MFPFLLALKFTHLFIFFFFSPLQNKFCSNHSSSINCNLDGGLVLYLLSQRANSAIAALSGEEVWKTENIRSLKHLVRPIFSAIRFLKQTSTTPIQLTNQDNPAVSSTPQKRSIAIAHATHYLAITLSLFR